jgi:hypothetical protein
MASLESVGGTPGGATIREFLLVGHNDDGTTAGGALNNVYNVTDAAYGAKGDATTDNYAAISAAALAAVNAGGGIVYIPSAPNAYLFNSTLPLYNNVFYVLGAGVNLKWGGIAGGTMFQQSNAAGPIIHSGVIGVDGGKAKITPNNNAAIVFDLHSPQFNVFRGLEIRQAQTTATTFKIQADAANTTGSLDSTKNALANVFEDMVVKTTGKVFEMTGTAGNVITLNHMNAINATDVRTVFADFVDYADNNDFRGNRCNLGATNSRMFRFQTVNCYGNNYEDCACDTIQAGSIAVEDNASRNFGYVFNNPRAPGGLFTGSAASYFLAAHSIDPDAPASGIEWHKKGVVDYGVAWHVRSVAANDTATAEDVVILCNATTAAFTETLPPASNKGQVLIIKKTDASANAVTISRQGADTIQGATTVSLASQWASHMLVADGVSTWIEVT